MQPGSPREFTAMALAPGTQVGACEVVGAIGAGGTGEVEPPCGRERSGSPQAKFRAKRGI